MKFKLHSNYQPRGDQPTAIDQLVRGVQAGDKHQVLLGVTGSGKTFTMAKVIEALDRPALVLAHNKTLAAQLYHEFKSFFPENAVEYFVSYYDYYQPEAYVPSADLYIDKESTINDELDKLRMSATRALFERRDVVIVSSVSCIYGLGSPEAYYGMLVLIEKGMETSREKLLHRFVDVQYERSEDLRRGTFRVRGDIIEIYPPYEDNAYRIEMWGNTVDKLRQIDPRGNDRQVLDRSRVYRLFDRRLPIHHQLVDGSLDLRRIEKRDGAVGLRIKIEKKDTFSLAGKGGGEINRGSGLPYPAFLVGDGNYHSRHSGSLALRGFITQAVAVITSGGRRPRR